MVFSCSTLSESTEERLVFERERVTIELNNDHVYVTGEYIFKNYSDKDLFIISYPFHIDECMFPPSETEVSLDGDMISYEKTNESTILFKLEIKKFEKKAVLVKFSQKVINRKNLKITYITKTTRTWDSPLKNAKFIIKIPKEYTVKEISFPVREIKEQDGFLIYYIDMDNFYPDIDLVVDLEIKDSKGDENI